METRLQFFHFFFFDWVVANGTKGRTNKQQNKEIKWKQDYNSFIVGHFICTFDNILIMVWTLSLIFSSDKLWMIQLACVLCSGYLAFKFGG